MPLEIERRWLLKNLDDVSSYSQDLEFHQIKYDALLITQNYLTTSALEQRRIRQVFVGPIERKYYLTNKLKQSKMTSVEHEEEIDSETYWWLRKNQCHPAYRTITKDRFVFNYQGHTFELDRFIEPFHLNILELELKSEDEKFELPPWLPIIKEVTGVKEYSNYHIAKAKVKSNDHTPMVGKNRNS